MSKFLKSSLRTVLDLIDQLPDGACRVSSRVSEATRRGKKVIFPQEDHTLRNLISLAAGLGLGIGAGLLFAPASGQETRDFIGEKVNEVGNRVRERFSSDLSTPPTAPEQQS